MLSQAWPQSSKSTAGMAPFVPMYAFPLSERLSPKTMNVNGSPAARFVRKVYAFLSASAGRFDYNNRSWLAFDVSLLHPHVDNMLQLLRRDHAAERIVGAEMDHWFAPARFGVCGRRAMRRPYAEVISFAKP